MSPKKLRVYSFLWAERAGVGVQVGVSILAVDRLDRTTQEPPPRNWSIGGYRTLDLISRATVCASNDNGCDPAALRRIHTTLRCSVHADKSSVILKALYSMGIGPLFGQPTASNMLDIRPGICLHGPVGEANTPVYITPQSSKPQANRSRHLWRLDTQEPGEHPITKICI